MKRPQKEDFGYVFGVGWTDPNGKRKYGNALVAWETRPRNLGGRPRIEPAHPSWTDYVAHFDPTNPARSQGAFCRWAGIRPSSLSAAKRKQIHIAMEEAISIWIEELQKLEADE